MQLNKIKLHSCTTFASAQSQITLDDDYNVPDYRPDIVKVLKEKGELHFDEVKAAAGAAWLKGRLVFRVLYRSDLENGKISCLKGEIPFQEKLNMDGVQEYDVIQASGEIEDLTIGVIHSRKISVRAVILLKTEEPREKEDELCVGAEADDGCEKRYRNTDILQLVCRKRDQCRQKSEITLPSSKPNVQEILWKSLEIRNLDTKMGQDGVKLSGEVLISVLYQEEEETDRVQWYEMVIPLDCGVECDAGAVLARMRLPAFLPEQELLLQWKQVPQICRYARSGDCLMAVPLPHISFLMLPDAAHLHPDHIRSLLEMLPVLLFG